MRLRQSDLDSASKSIIAHNEIFHPLKNPGVSTVKYIPPAMRRPAGEQIALLTLLRTTNGKECAAVLKRGTARAGWGDYQQLVDTAFAYKHPKGFLVLTAEGRSEAASIARQVAKEFGLHHFQTVGQRYTRSVMCSCGWKTTIPYFSRQTSGRQDDAMASHLRRVAENVESPSIVPGQIDG